MLTLILAAALAQDAAPPTTADTPSAVRLLFQAGDLRRAINMAKACAGAKKKAWKECAAMVKPLVEYQSVIGSEPAALTENDARALFAAEHQVSPEVPSKLSAEVMARFVTLPYEQAVAAQRAGDVALAEQLAKKVLAVQPGHEGALAIVGPPDAGHPDAGHLKKSARDAGR